MKHIKKKFQRLIVREVSSLTEVDLSDKTQVLSSKNQFYIVQIGDEYVPAINHSFQKINAPIPLPDITLVYFNFAYILNNELKLKYSTLTDILTTDRKFKEDCINEVYHYYGSASGFVITLFTAIESFVNSQIPEDFIYIKENPQRTESYNKKQIEKYIDFKTKIKVILPRATGKNFFRVSTKQNSNIFKLKELRDDIIHTKFHINENDAFTLYKQILEFKYDDIFNSVRCFMNFYKPNYIEDCDCGLET